MYQVLTTNDVLKETKKRGKLFHKKVSAILLSLTNNPIPSQSEKLTGEFNFIYSYHFSFTGTAFRLCYAINETEQKITIIMIGPRKNFYKKLKQKLS